MSEAKERRFLLQAEATGLAIFSPLTAGIM